MTQDESPMPKILDYVDLLPPSSSPRTWQETEAVCRQLRDLAKNRPIVIRLPKKS